MLLPFNLLYQMSSWTRAIVVSLAIVHAANPRRPVPAGFNWTKSGSPARAPRFDHDPSFLTLAQFLPQSDRSSSCGSGRLARIRRAAVEKAENWMLERLHHSDGLGAIYPPMMYSVMALDVLGYREGHPLRVEALRQFNNLMVDDGDRFFFQPCFSPVWDTAIGGLCAGAGRPDARSR